jgi:hypothetical protein
MSIIDVPVIPFRAGRHLAAWIVWHTARVSWLDDLAEKNAVVPPAPPYAKRRKAAGKR